MRKYHAAISKLAARESAVNATSSPETDDDGDADGDGASDDDDDDDDDQGSGSGQELNLRHWKPRRQFNSAMGMGIDTPMAQPPTNAYDVHNNIQSSAPWESNSNGADDGYYYYYYDDEAFDPDMPMPKKHQTHRQLLKMGARRILSVLKRPGESPHPPTIGRYVRGSPQKKYTHGNMAEMDFRMGRPRRFNKWRKIQH